MIFRRLFSLLLTFFILLKEGHHVTDLSHNLGTVGINQVMRYQIGSVKKSLQLDEWDGEAILRPTAG